MNSHDVLVCAARYSVAMARASQRRAEFGIAAECSQLVLIEGVSPPAAPHLAIQLTCLTSPKIKAPADYPAVLGRSTAKLGTQSCALAPGQTFRFICWFTLRSIWYTRLRINQISAALTMNFGSTEGYLVIARSCPTP